VTVTVWLLARALQHPTAGGHLWVYLNWALGLRALGCRVVWLEQADAASPERLRECLHALKSRLAPYGLSDSVAVCSLAGTALPTEVAPDCVPFEAADQADLLLDMAYGPGALVASFRRSALIDIDPGLCQIWVSRGQMELPPHDVYFTIGETVGQPGARFPDCGIDWCYTPPCVALDWWHVAPSRPGAPFTTVSNWIMNDYWVHDEEGGYANDKRSGFLPFLDLPNLVAFPPLELALSLGGAHDERVSLERRGWRVVEAHDLVASPASYQRYIARSFGEFSCAKPSCIRLQNAWVSDRTLCYLATGRPAVVQNTGPSRFLPDAEGLFRFTTPAEAARMIERVVDDYERQTRLARALAEEYFDASHVTAAVLERSLN
jgi:hypothetical protein